MKNNNFEKFQFNLDYAIKKLQSLPQSEKTDEVSVPLYLHQNFFVRNIFINRFKKAFKMTEFSQKQVLDYGCGSGMFLHALSNEIKNGIGVMPAFEEMLSYEEIEAVSYFVSTSTNQ